MKNDTRNTYKVYSSYTPNKQFFFTFYLFMDPLQFLEMIFGSIIVNV